MLLLLIWRTWCLFTIRYFLQLKDDLEVTWAIKIVRIGEVKVDLKSEFYTVSLLNEKIQYGKPIVTTLKNSSHFDSLEFLEDS